MSDPIANAKPLDTPPKTNGGSKSKSSSNSAPKTETKGPSTHLGKSLQNLYGQIGMMAFPFDQHCGGAVLENAESMAKAMEDLAKENQSVKRVLEKLAETSAVGTVFMAHAPVIMAITSHHGSQVAGLFTRKKSDKDDEKEEEKPETDFVASSVPPHYSHPGDNAA